MTTKYSGTVYKYTSCQEKQSRNIDIKNKCMRKLEYNKCLPQASEKGMGYLTSIIRPTRKPMG